MIIGGTVLPLVGIDYRVTVDIDIVSVGSSSTEDALILLGIADKLGLPVDAIKFKSAWMP